MIICGSKSDDGKVIFNRRVYNSIEEASLHLRVSAKDLRATLEGAKLRYIEAESRIQEEKPTQLKWNAWGFSYDEEFAVERSTGIPIDLELHINDEEYIDLDRLESDFQIPHIGDIGDMVDYEIYMEKRERKSQALVNIAKEISEGAVQLDIPFVDTTEEVKEEKESAGSWIKHNI